MNAGRTARRGAMFAVLVALACARSAARATPADPQPLVQVPLVQPDDGVDPTGPPFLGMLRMHIAASGFVRDVHFVVEAPADSARILARARRWIWEPARDSSGASVESWATFRVSSRAGQALIDRPDEALGAVLGEAGGAEVSLADSANGWRSREVDPVLFAHTFADWLSDPHAYAGPDPWRAQRAPRFDARVVFRGPTRSLQADLARGCAFMRVATKDRILFVPYGPIRDRIDADLARVFASRPAARR